MIEEATGRLYFGSLREAIERRDPDALLGFYAEDAELRMFNAALPDGKAFELKERSRSSATCGPAATSRTAASSWARSS